jgi:hypothetical protein
MRIVLFLAFCVFAILLGSWLFAQYEVQTVKSSDAQVFLTGIEAVARQAWQFARPLLQLLVVLMVLQWFLQQADFKMPASFSAIAWDARLLVALLVVLTFCLSALSGFMIEGLKEATLVVLGFYFGSLQKKEMQTEQTSANVPRTTPET